MLLCIDIGNTHTHFGLTGPDGAPVMRHVPTKHLDDPALGLPPHLAEHLATHKNLQGVAYCTVVPEAGQRLQRHLAHAHPALPVLQLTHRIPLGLPIGYPRPAEIGPDRLANAAGAQALTGSPAIIIDMGTAVTLDIVTPARGYEGGIIAPGVEVMRRYLHEQTALLPLLDDSIAITRAIGQSTTEAMRIGTVLGFGGMIQTLLDAVLAELSARGEAPPHLLTTGGSADLLKKTLRHPYQQVPDITLRGLHAVWHLNRP